MEAKSKTERELGAWLREKGVHSDRLKRWEEEIVLALESAEVNTGEKRLERELAREKHPERWSHNVRKWNRPQVVILNPRRKRKEILAT